MKLCVCGHNILEHHKDGELDSITECIVCECEGYDARTDAEMYLGEVGETKI